VLIRDMHIAGHLRATIGLPAENDALLARSAELAGSDLVGGQHQ
jgi:histidinol-phosphate aminotransferase